jgi:hypothetical protein
MTARSPIVSDKRAENTAPEGRREILAGREPGQWIPEPKERIVKNGDPGLAIFIFVRRLHKYAGRFQKRYAKSLSCHVAADRPHFAT